MDATLASLGDSGVLGWTNQAGDITLNRDLAQANLLGAGVEEVFERLFNTLDGQQDLVKGDEGAIYAKRFLDNIVEQGGGFSLFLNTQDGVRGLSATNEQLKDVLRTDFTAARLAADQELAGLEFSAQFSDPMRQTVSGLEAFTEALDELQQSNLSEEEKTLTTARILARAEESLAHQASEGLLTSDEINAAHLLWNASLSDRDIDPSAFTTDRSILEHASSFSSEAEMKQLQAKVNAGQASALEAFMLRDMEHDLLENPTEAEQYFGYASTAIAQHPMAEDYSVRQLEQQYADFHTQRVAQEDAEYRAYMDSLYTSPEEIDRIDEINRIASTLQNIEGEKPENRFDRAESYLSMFENLQQSREVFSDDELVNIVSMTMAGNDWGLTGKSFEYLNDAITQDDLGKFVELMDRSDYVATYNAENPDQVIANYRKAFAAVDATLTITGGMAQIYGGSKAIVTGVGAGGGAVIGTHGVTNVLDGVRDLATVFGQGEEINTLYQQLGLDNVDARLVYEQMLRATDGGMSSLTGRDLRRTDEAYQSAANAAFHAVDLMTTVGGWMSRSPSSDGMDRIFNRSMHEGGTLDVIMTWNRSNFGRAQVMSDSYSMKNNIQELLNYYQAQREAVQ